MVRVSDAFIIVCEGNGADLDHLVLCVLQTGCFRINQRPSSRVRYGRVELPALESACSALGSGRSFEPLSLHSASQTSEGAKFSFRFLANGRYRPSV